MHTESLREYILTKARVVESFPFGKSTLVFKVDNKIFVLLSLDSIPLQFNVKCNPEKAIQLREEHPEEILPGYHMNKKHWNTVIVNGKLKESLLTEMIDESYNLVAKKIIG